MIIISHPTGNENVRNAALAMLEGGILDGIWTCVGWSDRHMATRILPNGCRKTFNRRLLPEQLMSKARYLPFMEIMRLGFGRVTPGDVNSLPFGIDDVYRNLDRSVAREIRATQSASAVYCYEDGACETFRSARERSLKTLYELPMGYWRAWHSILQEEVLLNPEWAKTLQGIDDSNEKLARKDAELASADHIFVASSFACSSIKDAAKSGATVHQVRYGASQAIPGDLVTRKHDVLRILFVGALTQRKGISYLFQAVRQFKKNVKVTLIGRLTHRDCSALNRALGEHHWLESIPHEKVLEVMRDHDVLVFPSLFEGYGLVISEAMSQGLPVITTQNTAGPDLVTHGRDGFIVPIRSSEAIAEKLELLIMKPYLIAEMKQAALQSSAAFSWAKYRSKLLEELKKCGLQ